MSIPAESAQGSACVTDVIAVRGGGIPLDAQLHLSWIVPFVVFEEEGDNGVTIIRRFVDIYLRDFKCQKYLNNRFSMTHYIRKVRNNKMLELMQGLLKEEDPNRECHENDRMPSLPKRELVDKLPKYVDLEIETKSWAELIVSVRSSWRMNGVLQVEATQQNFDLLLEDPPDGSAKFTPTIQEDNVRWVPDRMQLRTKHWDSKKRKFTITSMNTEFEPHWGDVEKQEHVDKKARQLQEQFEEKHDTLNNMPRDESAESAPETDERPAKKRKTDD